MEHHRNEGGSGRLPRNVKLLAWASFLNDVASEMIVPLLPEFLLHSLGGTRWQLGIIEGLADSVSSLVRPGIGVWSDRAGKRKGFVVAGYAMAALTRPVIGLVTLPWQLLLLRATDRLGKGIRTAPRDALIADSTEPAVRGRAFGFHRGMDHLGAAIGPVLAALFLWRWPGAVRPLFLLALVPGLVVVALVGVGLAEVAPKGTSARPIVWKLRPLGRQFILYLGAVALFTLANSSDTFLLVRARELGVALWLLPLLWCAAHLVKSAGNLLAGPLVDRVGPRPLILAGWVLYAGIYAAFGLANAAWHVWLLFLAYALFYALTEPAERTLVARLVPAEQRGLAYGWFHAAVGIGALPASVLFGGLYDRFGPTLAFGTAAGLALLAALLFTTVREQ